MIGLRVLRAGDAERRKLDQIRGQIEALGQSIDQIADAPMPPAEAAARLLARLQPLIDDARGRLLAIARPAAYATDYFDSAPPAAMRNPLTAALVAEALFRPAGFEKALTALVSAGTPGLAAEARAQKIADLRRKLEQLEIAEEQEILRLLAAGCCVEVRLEVPIQRCIAVWASDAA